MSTKIRAELSKKNKYWISRHRYYELKHFCLQYPTWKSIYASLDNTGIHAITVEKFPTSNVPADPTSKQVILKAYYKEKIDLIEKTAFEADRYLYIYILKAVTEELSYTYLKTKMNIPCGKDMYYDRYHKFFWLLSEARD